MAAQNLPPDTPAQNGTTLHDLTGQRIPDLPPNAPTQHSALLRKIARAWMALYGWRVVGQFPDLPKMMMIAAPHSSNWDGLWGILAKIALGVKIQFIAKNSLFVWPLGWFLRAMGAIPIDRSAAHGVVDAMANVIRHSDKRWLLIAPEGTRRKVEKWKSGFWHIAKAANVPVFVIYFHYPEKVVGLGKLFYLTDDMDADIQAMRDFLKPYQGKNHGV